MSLSIRTLTVCAAGMLTLSACATRGALRRGLEEERNARIAADNAQQGDIAALRIDVTNLRNDLNGLRSEFGAKIAEVSQGLQFAMPVHFAYDDASVRSADMAALDRFASVAAKYYPGSKVTVEGFADPAGSVEYNLDLSQRRANAVRSYVTSRGLDASLVRAVGYGESRLVRPDASRYQPGAELNRRVVFVIETPGEARAATVAALDGM
jgi:outer membrane protein OmpA-like peptidoglycan-associated protein